MRDEGHDETEEILEEIEKRISEVYAQAEKEVAATLDDYLRKFETKDKLKLKALANGLITEEEYKQWRVGQIAIGQRWAEMRDTLAQDFTNADKIARSIAFDHMPEVYALNHNYGTFQVEKASGIDTSYTLYDTNAFEELMKNEDTFIPAPGRKVSRDIKEGKALAWNKKAVQSAMMQSLLQGESIPKIATRLAKTVGESDRKAAIRNARTLTTGVENAGRIASYDQANKMGIPTRKQWLATLDSRTRHWHASLDGETVDNDKPFVNEFGEIMYPGDPKADPANIFNCRCTLIASIKGFERDVSDLSLRHDDHLKDMTYDEWKAGHYEQTSDSQDKQDQTEETMRYAYGAEYRKYKNIDDEENMAKSSSRLDFSELKPMELTWDQRNDIIAYAKNKNINVQNIRKFCGNPDLLKEQIDVLYDIMQEYDYKNRMTIGFFNTHECDFAKTSKNGNVFFNSFALIDRDFTNSIINATEGEILSEIDVKGIAAHEFGHVLQNKFKNNSVEICKKIYYNIDENISDTDLAEKLKETLESTYAFSVLTEDGYPSELQSEILGKQKTNPNDFTKAYVKLLKEVVK